MVKLEEVFPCIVPERYLTEVGASNCIHRPFGNGLLAMLVIDAGNSIRSLSPGEIGALVESLDDAWDLAIYNLDQKFQRQEVVVNVVAYPSGEKAAFIGPTYLAPALLLHPGAFAWLGQLLGAEDLVATVPERDAAFVYSSSAAGDVLAGAEKFAAEAAANSRKPYGRNLFRLGGAGVEPLPA